MRWVPALAAVVAALVAAPACAPAAARGHAAPAVRIRVYRFVDRSRAIRLPDGEREPRPVTVVVRYPAQAVREPLIVFGHGFALTPATYRNLLNAWARAGYVVAAPVFPLGNADAPGGPDESDILNQPGDMSFTITQLERVLRSRIDPARVAVAGHSDGAVTALEAAYDRRFRDRRIRAAIVLSGAEAGGFGSFPRDGPPLLAVQGTADPINPPAATTYYFAAARRPKFLLLLLGASHLPPYTYEQPQLSIVERVTLAFLGHYLEGRPLSALSAAARRPGLTRFTALP